MPSGRKKKRFLVCVRNTGYPASLELRKIYEALPDDDAAGHGLVRVIDESGEDYLYPSNFFKAVNLPRKLPVRYAEPQAEGGTCRTSRSSGPV
jgi:hypothetical protein